MDRYQRPQKISLQEEKARQRAARRSAKPPEYAVVHPPKREEEKAVAEARRYPSEPEETCSTLWTKTPRSRALAARDPAHRAQGEPVFHPQKQTQVMNEGGPTFWHYTILTSVRRGKSDRAVYDGISA
ncbi:SpoVR family protein [Shigella flexneri]